MDVHEGEGLDIIKFNMRVIRFHKTAFETQIHESVLIQENRSHNLLSLKSESNHCAIPRLTMKMGDRDMKSEEEKLERDAKREEELKMKIRGLKKQRSRLRRNCRGTPERKRLKLDEEIVGNEENIEKNSPEKRQKEIDAEDQRNVLWMDINIL